MQFRISRRAALLAAGALAVPAVALAAPGASSGPSSSESPYLVPSQPGVVTKSIITVGDSVNDKPDGTPYRMVGIPDGLGAFDNGDGTFTVLMNHELNAAEGTERAHGAIGAFVSRWTIDKETLAVRKGEDLIQQIATYDKATGTYNPFAKGITLARLCSANLPPVSAYFDAASGKGYAGRIFNDGEETSPEGRALAHLLNGDSYELPALGRMAFENVVANPATGEKTVTVGTDDSTPGQVYVYVGAKRADGSPVDKAGLTGGTLYGIKVAGMRDERTDFATRGGTFTLASLGDVSRKTGAELETDSDAAGVTEFFRPEDAGWDPTNPNVLYFNTTAAFDQPSRLWKVTFADVSDPAAGGTIEPVLDGTEGQKMLDNLVVNGRGQVLEQEDPGNNAYLAKVRLYDPAGDTLTEIAKHDPERFLAGGSKFITTDEESSGIISVGDILGAGWYLADVQAHHKLADPELVENGQLLAIQVPPGRPH